MPSERLTSTETSSSDPGRAPDPIVSREGTKDGDAGAFNVANNDPATAREWMPVFASAIGAPRPLRAPAFVARLVAGRAVVHIALAARGASNRRLRDELGWQPRIESWRTGFLTLR